MEKSEDVSDIFEVLRGVQESKVKILQDQLSARCPKCGDVVLGDTSGLCRNCV